MVKTKQNQKWFVIISSFVAFPCIVAFIIYHLYIDWYCFQMSPPLLNIVREKILVTTFLQYVPAWYARRLFVVKIVKTGTLSRLFCDSTHHSKSSALLLQSNIGVYTLGIYLYSDYTENTNFNRITKTSVCHVKE